MACCCDIACQLIIDDDGDAKAREIIHSHSVQRCPRQILAVYAGCPILVPNRERPVLPSVSVTGNRLKLQTAWIIEVRRELE